MTTLESPVTAAVGSDEAAPATARPAGEPAKSNAQVKAEGRHVFYAWSAQQVLDPMPVAGASGSYFWDYDGNKFLDFSCQLVNTNIGHQHPKIVAAIQEQAATLCTISPFVANEARNQAARLVAEVAPAGLDKVLFTTGGTEANENALRLARLHTGRNKVLSAYRSYHGGTAGSATISGDPRRWAAEPGIAGTAKFWGPYLYRSPFFAQTAEEECERALQHLRDTLMVEGPHTVAAIFLETVVGTNGVIVPPDGYLAGVREICDQHGILLVLDEVMAGFGRCGEWFAVQHWGVTPDLMTFAKGVNSGYVPLGGVLISDAVAGSFQDRPYPAGLTYSGHPLACASAVASIEVFREEGIVDNARRIGEDVLGPGLRELAEKHPSVGEVRGLGVFWAVELVRDRMTREPLVPFNAAGPAAGPMVEFTKACKSRGLWPFIHFNRTHATPPCTVSDDEVREGLGILDQALDTADRFYTGS